MLTSGDLQGETARCRELGVAAHLVKPIPQAELLESIRTALRLSGERINVCVDAAAGPKVAKVNPRRVLLAEDNQVNQKVVVRILEKAGHHVVVAENGKRLKWSRRARHRWSAC